MVDRHSPRRRSSPRREKPFDRRRSSPEKKSLPPRSRARSPPAAAAGTTPPRSPSPRTKRLRRAQAEREEGKPEGGEYRRISSREERDREEGKGERRSGREKDGAGGGSSRPSRRERSASPEERNGRARSRSRSHSPRRGSRAGRRDEGNRSRAAEELWGAERDSVAKMKAAEEALEVKDKQKPSFELSGKLAEETNRVRGVTLLFTEPSDARKPDVRWRLYVFKGGEVLKDPLYVHRQSCYLFGRERRVADIPTDHPSCSKQHAVIQYRLVEKEKPDGLSSKQVRPYLMDLGSTNGTFINDNRIEPQRYYELFEKDTIRFGNSSREYVLLHENSVQ